MMNKLRYFSDAMAFVIRKHFIGYEVAATPSFDEEGLAFFNDRIRKSRTYLEYGSGGSTVRAASHVDLVVSVESDAVFKRAVQRKLPFPRRTTVQFLTPNIGVTGAWGMPVFGRPTHARIQRWKRYPQAPWIFLKTPPDTILIDGRMRVACALESLLNVSDETCLVVDDYYMNRDYSAIEKFADIVGRHGRMAEFRKKRGFDQDQCRQTLEQFYSVLV